ncbi:DUF1343 domain-containing protein, partial [candidate division KSB1 bacterium]|nr:DUF1343 domain-containing protein [candidate division KSB1 bacterium]
HEHPDVRLTALFGPEHGVRGDVEAGRRIDHYVDEKTGIQVFSLYGRQHKPTAEMLQHVDVLMYDIQDIGSRAYTYIYTMAMGMEAAKEKGIPFIVLDRPNPLGGELLEGPVLDPAFKSFIGLYPIPYVYGMTVGELAQLFNMEFDIKCDLTVIPMKGWKRTMFFQDTGVMWIPTSPHVPQINTSWFVAATGCIGELGTVNEGVGYPTPFELIGAPWINAQQLADELNARQLPGILFRPQHYRPYYGTFKEQTIPGVQLHILDYAKVQPMRVQIHILHALRKLYPEENFFDSRRISSFNKAMGTDRVQQQLADRLTPDQIITGWQQDLEAFEKSRKKYLLY